MLEENNISYHLNTIVQRYGSHQEDIREPYFSHKKEIDSIVQPFYYNGEVWNSKFDYDSFYHRNNVLYNRYINTLHLLNETVNHFGKKLPKTTLFVKLTDGEIPYDMFSDLKIPLCTTSLELNKTSFLIPDGEYQCYSFDKSSDFLTDKDVCYDWDQIKLYASKEVKKNTKKEHKIYFTGNNSGKNTHNIRQSIKRLTEDNNLFDIKVSAKESRYEYEPFYLWSKYSYLLDLPGINLTSRRFKYLFLCNSTVIKISLLQRKPSGSLGYPTIQFLDLFVNPNKDYINITTDVIYNNREYNFDKYKKVLEKLEHIADMNPRKFSKVKNNGYNKVSSLTNEIIYKYIRKLIYANNKLVLPFNPWKSL